jgi:hypothetical protein
MKTPVFLTSLWVDSMDRPDWQDRAKEALNMDGVKEIKVFPESGEVEVSYDPTLIRPILLHSHLRAAGL